MERKQYPWKLAKLQHVFVRHGICADQEITATESSGKSFIYRTFDVTLSIENNHQQTHLVQFPNLHDGHYQHSALSSCHICKRVETCMKVTTTTWCFFADGEDPIVHLVPNFCLHCIPEYVLSALEFPTFSFSWIFQSPVTSCPCDPPSNGVLSTSFSCAPLHQGWCTRRRPSCWVPPTPCWYRGRRGLWARRCPGRRCEGWWRWAGWPPDWGSHCWTGSWTCSSCSRAPPSSASPANILWWRT